MKSGKACGPDGIPAEIYKNGGPGLIQSLLDLFLMIWDKETLPADLKDANIVTIFKKGERTLCGNYRGISLLSISGKIFARILAKRLGSLAEERLPETQCGFRPGRGTVDMIFAARQIQEKCMEQQRELYMAFIDLTKAFDTVDRLTLWSILEKAGCPKKFVTMIRLLHNQMNASVLVDGDSTDKFEVKTGVKQGCVLAPTLFSIFLTAVLELVKQHMPNGVKIRYRMDDIFNIRRLRAKTKTKSLTVCELQYADDNAILANTKEDLQNTMDAFNAAYTQLGLKLNIKKTQVLHQTRLGDSDSQPVIITVGGQALDIVESFIYFGTSLSFGATFDAKIKQRIQAANTAFAHLRERVLRKKRKFMLEPR